MIKSRELRRLLKGVDVAAAFGVSFGNKTNTNTICPFHEVQGESKSKSCFVSVDGLFICYGCSEKGDVFDFVAQRDGITRPEAIHKLQKAGIRKDSETGKQQAKARASRRQLKESMVPRAQELLAIREDWKQYLAGRGITSNTAVEYEIGCDEYRLTLPVRDSEGNLVNLRRYSPYQKPKMISFAAGYGSVRLYPLPQFLQQSEAFPNQPVILCEGEWDCLLLRQLGYNAITVAAGVTSWDNEFNEYFRGRDVYIVFDVHDKKNVGTIEAQARAQALLKVEARPRIVMLDLPTSYVGGDVTDYFVKEKRTKDDFQQLLDQAPLYEIDITTAKDPVEGSDEFVDVDDLGNLEKYPMITLSQASHSKHYFKRLRMRCLVAGKGVAPYMPPREVVVETMDDNGIKDVFSHTFSPWDGAILSLIQTSTVRLHSFLRTWFGIPKKTEMHLEIKSTFNIEELFLIPAIDVKQDQGPYVIRKCYYVGHSIQANKVYDFVGYTLPDPKDQAATHILTHAEPAETDIDSFLLEPDELKELKDVFQTDNISAKMADIAAQMSEHVTRIYGRPDLHTAVDLVYHSPLFFDFDGTPLKKGWLEILIMGDTRTGKGYVTEGLCKHYVAGEVVSGENLSLAGLVGGVQHLGDKWTLVWGKLPLADRRLVVIDESSSLSQTEIGRLSRIRSEGVAEITKVVSEKTTARTRLIWISNPRSMGAETSRVLADYNYGIETVPELIGAAEDIARFDYVMLVGHSEVPSAEINKSHAIKTELRYTSELCHNLIMWVWSRKPEDIVFESGVEHYIMELAQKLSSRYTSKIPLVQIEDVRFKLARMAAAVAGRTFSTDDGIKLIIKEEHAKFAYDFINRLYTNPVCGYAQLSSVEKERQTLKDPQKVLDLLAMCGGQNVQSLIDGMLEHRKLTPRDLCDYASVDLYQARSTISELVRLRAIVKEHSYYIKKPSFKNFLRKLKREGLPDSLDTESTSLISELKENGEI